MMKASGEKLPAWFKEHIVCWYSPKRQGATNESLAADPILKDLSGKNHDMMLYNFSFTSESGIASDSSLHFGGVDDYARTISPFIMGNDFTVIVKRKYIKTSHVALCGKNNNADKPILFISSEWYKSAPIVGIFGKNSYDNTNPYTRLVDWLTPTSIHSEQIISRGDIADSNGSLFIGKMSQIDTRYFNGYLYDFFLFDKTLTQDQIDYVVNNLID